MTTVVSTSQPSDIIYPSADGEPVAETYDHLYVILTTLAVLKQYLPEPRTVPLVSNYGGVVRCGNLFPCKF